MKSFHGHGGPYSFTNSDKLSTTLSTSSRPDDIRVLDEVKLLTWLKHPNILKVYGAVSGKVEKQLAILLEYAPCGDLAAVVRNYEQIKYSVTDGMNWISQVASALSYLHSRPRPLIHRDVKPQNIFMTVRNGEIVALLGDFGFVVELDGPDAKVSKECGTPGYMAPEINGPDGYSISVDTFALGCTMKVVLSRKPWGAYYSLDSIYSDESLTPLPDILFNLVRSCMNDEPTLRTTCQEVVESLENWITLQTAEKPTVVKCEGDYFADKMKKYEEINLKLRETIRKKKEEIKGSKEFSMSNVVKENFMDGFYSVRNGVNLEVVDCKWTNEQKECLKKIGEPGFEAVLVTGALGSGKTNVLIAHAVLEFLRRPKDTVVIFCCYSREHYPKRIDSDSLSLLHRVRKDIIESVGEGKVDFNEQLLTIAPGQLQISNILNRNLKSKYSNIIFLGDEFLTSEKKISKFEQQLYTKDRETEMANVFQTAFQEIGTEFKRYKLDELVSCCWLAFPDLPRESIKILESRKAFKTDCFDFELMNLGAKSKRTAIRIVKFINDTCEKLGIPTKWSETNEVTDTENFGEVNILNIRELSDEELQELVADALVIRPEQAYDCFQREHLSNIYQIKHLSKRTSIKSCSRSETYVENNLFFYYSPVTGSEHDNVVLLINFDAKFDSSTREYNFVDHWSNYFITQPQKFLLFASRARNRLSIIFHHDHDQNEQHGKSELVFSKMISAIGKARQDWQHKLHRSDFEDRKGLTSLDWCVRLHDLRLAEILLKQSPTKNVVSRGLHGGAR